MSQPQFQDGPAVPLMVEGAIDADTLRRLFADLTEAATVVGVREKSSPAAYTAADETLPEVALERLLSGAARAIQVRYRFADYEWTDTILGLPGGFRVVRCRHTPAS
jgi:hypothetical protein